MMKRFHQKESSFFFFIIVGMFFSVISSWFYFKQLKNKLTLEFLGIEIILDAETSFDGTLFYTYNRAFDSKHTLSDLNPGEDTLLFKVPKNKEVLKRFRLDFGSDDRIKALKISQINFLFENDTVRFKDEALIQRYSNTSESLLLDKNSGVISFRKEVKPFDPYLVFSPLVEFIVDKKQYTIYLLAPLMICVLIYYLRRPNTFSLTIADFLFLLFVVCIPLKIAWTTFATILLAIFGVYRVLVLKKPLVNKTLAFFIFLVFILLVILGRPSSFSDIDIQLGFLIWAVISLTTTVPKEELYRHYINYFTLIIVAVTASAIGFMLWFNDFYGLNLSEYFKDIKLYSRDVRGWLYYDHAAFISFFGIVGLLFVQSLYTQRRISKLMVWAYHILILTFIFLTATRIGFVIYFIVTLNTFLRMGHKKRLIINSLAFTVFASILFFGIGQIDTNRGIVWKNSWNLIKSQPFFGHGIGQSNNALQSLYGNNENIGMPILELNHSHNQYLTYLLELGFFGFFGLFVGLIFFLLRSGQYKNGMMITYVFACGYLFLTESPMQTSKPLYVLMFLLLLTFSEDFGIERGEKLNAPLKKPRK